MSQKTPISSKNNSGSRRSRFRLLILPEFQIYFIVLVVGLSLIQTMVIQYSIWYFSSAIMAEFDTREFSGDSPMRQFIIEQLAALNWMGLRIGVLLALINATILLMFSHKIAGPVYRIQRTIDSWMNGGNEILKVRKGDFFIDLAAQIQ